MRICSCGQWMTMRRASVLGCAHCDTLCAVNRCARCTNLTRAPGRGPATR